MRLTVIGRDGPYPSASGACSCYLAESGGERVALDLGTGSVARLQHFVRLEELSALLLSHWHFDHMSDLFSLQYALGGMVNAGKRGPLRVYSPKMPDELKPLLAAAACEWHEIDDETECTIGELSVSWHAMTHPIPSFAIRISAGDACLVYSGDTTYNERIAKAAAGADLLLCDAPFSNAEHAPSLPHMSATQAAQIAREAGIVQLLLTHIRPESDTSILFEEAAKVFENVAVAEPLRSYVLP